MSRKKNLLSSLGEKRNLLAGSPIFMRTERGPVAKGFFCLNERSSGAVIRLLNALYLCQKLSNRMINSWIKRDQLDVTCFIASLFNAQHVSGVNTSILRSLRLICWVISWVVLLWFDAFWCYCVVWLGWCGIRMQAEALHILSIK